MLNKSGIAIALRNSKLLYGAYLSLAATLRAKKYDQLGAFVLFLGYPRSGSSIVGSLLDAHERVSISHELNILNYLEKGFSKRQLMYLIDRNSEIVAKKDRISSGYKGLVQGQFNGKTANPLLLGDKKAGGTTKVLTRTPELLEMAKQRFGIPIKIIHCVRNPFDMITTQAYGGNERKEVIDAQKIQKSIAFFFEKAETVKEIIDKGKNEVYTLHHDDLIEEPEKELCTLFNWLEIPVTEQYLSACEQRLYKRAHNSRQVYNWSEEEISKVQEKLQEYSFFERYTFGK